MGDYYVPTDPKAGMVIRRMLYLLHEMTFRGYFLTSPYVDVLGQHAERVGKAPETIDFNLGKPETQVRLEKLVDSLNTSGFGNAPLADQFNPPQELPEAVWTASEKVEEAGIFIPYYHARDKTLVADLLNDGFLDETEGWGSYNLHVLFSTAGSTYTTPAHRQRLRTLTKAKKANVVRPSRLYAAAEGTILSNDPSKEHCCDGGSCIHVSDLSLCCTEVESACSAWSDPCP